MLPEGAREHIPETRWRAQELYCADRLPFTRVAEMTGVADSTLRRWADEYGWRERREQIAQAEAELRADKVLARSRMVKSLIDNQRPDAAFAVAALEAQALKEAEAARRNEQVAPAVSGGQPITTQEEAIAALGEAVRARLGAMARDASAVTGAALRDMRQCLELLAALGAKTDAAVGRPLSVESAAALRAALG